MRAFHHTIFLTVVMTCLFASSLAFAQGLVVRRAAYDIGSASIKCTIADVEVGTGHIKEVIATLSEKVDFAEDLSRAYDSNLSNEIMDKGIEALEKIKQTAIKMNALEYSAVGGSVFREARNGRAYFVRIKEETGISSRVISEQQAAMLSYHAVNQVFDASGRDLLVWDIGGGSQQMTARRTDGGLQFYLDPMASVTFKNVVIGTIQKKNTAVTPSPNPVSREQADEALIYAQAHAATSVPPALSARLHHTGMIVAGIGGVHYYSIPEVMGGRERFYTRDQVAETLDKWVGRPDEDFDSEYAATRLTNLILVLGYMDALGISKVHPLKINLADGLFAAPEFW